MPDLASWIGLSLVPEIGPVSFRKLVSLFGEPEAVFRASEDELARQSGIGDKKARNIKAFDGWKVVERHLRAIEKLGARTVTFRCPEYPQLLGQIESGPVILYMKGSIAEPDRFAIAVVGSRKPTPYGKMAAERLSAELADYGFTIVSGLARGVDAVAHGSSLRAGGRTIAVLGTGIDRVYPTENRQLRDRIEQSGCVLSEFPIGTGPNRENFPTRNRLISGLSLGVLVIEATRDSGSLITAQCSLEQNREVFSVPGSIYSENSSGTNDLIKRGAKLVQSPADIIDELGPMLRGFIRERGRPSLELSDHEKRVCDILCGEPAHIDVLSRELSLPPAAVLASLLNLELKGIVRQAEGKRFYLIQHP